ncbi:transmembrane protein 14C isoform X1 [Cebus imitator]|uniref:transmembrane protein 14C isoform X1 n=1 Tax=Cebus imitator TaxID=2715852 RepID=UPI000809A3B1|nr:transmembrane protein 14C isoform X1 [Cebus imitator]XP_017382192.1 transmembrane protein 14C isoform X1 [Cebus imitator]XP_017382195.1 transmembrane protein 14C isoform X1 [Cebus imitator]
MQDTGSVVPLHWIGFGYAALVATGGIIGYVKAGSVPSLAAGLLFGSLAGLGSYQLSQDPRNVWVFLAATSGTFASVMALRSYYHGKVMPVGLIAGASWAILPSPLHSFLGDGPSAQLFHLQRQVQPSQFKVSNNHKISADGWRFYLVVPFCYICLRSHRWLQLERASPSFSSPLRPQP